MDKRSARQKSDPKQSVENYGSVAGARPLHDKVNGLRTLKRFSAKYGTEEVSP